MSQFKNREKRQALLFVTLGVVVTLFSYQNFQYPEDIKKSSVDVDASLNASDLELNHTRQSLTEKVNPQARNLSSPMIPKTQVVEGAAPMKLKLKRAPAKSALSKKKTKKSHAVANKAKNKSRKNKRSSKP